MKTWKNLGLAFSLILVSQLSLAITPQKGVVCTSAGPKGEEQFLQVYCLSGPGKIDKSAECVLQSFEKSPIDGRFDLKGAGGELLRFNSGDGQLIKHLSEENAEEEVPAHNSIVGTRVWPLDQLCHSLAKIDTSEKRKEFLKNFIKKRKEILAKQKEEKCTWNFIANRQLNQELEKINQIIRAMQLADIISKEEISEIK